MLESTLLPSNLESNVINRVVMYPGTFSHSWNELVLFLISTMFFFFSFMIFILFQSRTSFILSFCAFFVSGFLLALVYFVRKESIRVYNISVSDGTCQEGIFIFPTGDVVIRFNRPGFHTEVEVPSNSVKRVFSMESSILYIDTDTLTIEIKQDKLVRSIDEIAIEMRKLLHLQ